MSKGVGKGVENSDTGPGEGKGVKAGDGDCVR